MTARNVLEQVRKSVAAMIARARDNVPVAKVLERLCGLGLTTILKQSRAANVKEADVVLNAAEKDRQRKSVLRVLEQAKCLARQLPHVFSVIPATQLPMAWMLCQRQIMQMLIIELTLILSNNVRNNRMWLENSYNVVQDEDVPKEGLHGRRLLQTIILTISYLAN